MSQADSCFHTIVIEATALVEHLSIDLTLYLDKQDKLIAERDSVQASLHQIDEDIQKMQDKLSGNPSL